MGSTASIGDILTPTETPLPEPPAGEPFSPEQWATLMAIMDTVIPSVKRGATASNKISQYTISEVEYNKTVDHLKKTVVGAPEGQALDEYLDEKPSDYPRFQELLRRSLIDFSRDDARKSLAFILWALK
jgi:hypothetical protein